MDAKSLVPQPGSKFLRVKCSKCGNEQIVFDRSQVSVNCSVCEEPLLIVTGGKSEIKAEILESLG